MCSRTKGEQQTMKAVNKCDLSTDQHYGEWLCHKGDNRIENESPKLNKRIRLYKSCQSERDGERWREKKNESKNPISTVFSPNSPSGNHVCGFRDTFQPLLTNTCS